MNNPTPHQIYLYCSLSFWSYIDGEITLDTLQRRMNKIGAKQGRLF